MVFVQLLSSLPTMSSYWGKKNSCGWIDLIFKNFYDTHFMVLINMGSKEG